MKGLRRSSNPFLKGTRPRRVFTELSDKLYSMKSTNVKKFDPDWNKVKVA